MPDAAIRIPRSTCQLFGAIKALSTMKNTCILVHGPKGCVYHINYILGMRGDRPREIFSTCLNEHDVIFGAEDRLTRAICELDREIHPDLLVVLSCCASGIIGEDVHAAVRAASVSTQVLAIDSGGFEGDHAEGYRDTLIRIAASLAGSTGHRDPHAVNLLGVLRAGPDLGEIRRILTSAGIRVAAVLTAGTGMADLGRMGDAGLNIVLCETSGLGAAEVLLSRFGTPYIVTDLPIGIPATDTFLDTIRSALSLPCPEKSTSPHEPIPPLDPSHRIAIFSGPTRAIALSRFLSGLSNPPRLIVLDFLPPSLEKVAAAAGPGCVILVEPDSGEIRDALAAEEITLVLGGMLERPVAGMLGIRLIDVMHGSQRTVGYEGARILAALIAGEKK